MTLLIPDAQQERWREAGGGQSLALIYLAEYFHVSTAQPRAGRRKRTENYVLTYTFTLTLIW